MNVVNKETPESHEGKPPTPSSEAAWMKTSKSCQWDEKNASEGFNFAVKCEDIVNKVIGLKKQPKKRLTVCLFKTKVIANAVKMRALNTELKDFKFKMLLMRAAEKMSRWVPAREDQTLWVLLQQAKRQEERAGDAKFIRTVQVHPECACILAHPCQLEEVKPFCTNQKEFTIFGADPTFNIFTKNMSYHHHIPQLKTGASWDWRKPRFHWPSTDASAQGSSHISQLCPCLGSENPNLECILACETDGEKPLYRFRRVLKYAVFLLCSLHFKQNKEG